MKKENFFKRIWNRLGNSDIDNNEIRLSDSELAELANIEKEEEEIRKGGSRARGFVIKASVDEKVAGRTAKQRTGGTAQKTLENK